MSKYILELKDDVQVVQKVGVTENGNAFVMNFYKDQLEELNSDYINEHFGDLQDTAYQRGLNDAWECAEKLFSTMSDTEIEKVFPTEWENGFYGLMQMKPQYAIAKLKAYEEKQKADDKIKVGDVVMIKQFKHPENHLFVVTKVSDESVWGVEGDGSWNYWAINEVIKTDKHFDIASILEEMRHD